MKVLRRFPGLAGALRDGRLCLSTLALLGQVLTGENAEELVARAAWRTTAEVDHLVASLKPRPAPREGIRKLSGPGGTAREASPPVTSSTSQGEAVAALALMSAPSEPPPALLEAPRPRTAEMRAVSEGQWSLRATIDRACKNDLETLSMLLSHKVRRGDLAAVLHEAIRCGIEKHGKRKGAVRPARKVAPKATRSKDPAAIPAEVRRQVWERDRGRCAWTGPDGKRCGSRWQLEVDHVDPVARGGTSALGALRVLCRNHNLLYAEQVYGREFMQKYRKGEFAIDGGSGGAGRARREAHAAG
jgi:5-methylcytosine-specific restriction endonuclease McrA